MEITSIRIFKVPVVQNNLIAVASVVFDDFLAVHDIKIINGKEGLFIGMPSRKKSGEGFRDIVHPISAEARKVIQDAIIAAYQAEIE